MVGSEALEEIVVYPVCGICQKSNTPLHAVSHPIKGSDSNEEHKFCCDSRSDECPHSEIRENKRYCKYPNN